MTTVFVGNISERAPDAMIRTMLQVGVQHTQTTHSRLMNIIQIQKHCFFSIRLDWNNWSLSSEFHFVSFKQLK